MNRLNDFFNTINDGLEYIVTFVSHFGMFGAVLMAVVEAIFPSLPMVAIAAANVKNYGFFGFVLTYIGAVLGTFLVFIVIRKLLARRFQESKFLKKHRRVKQMMDWIENKGFASVTLLMCLPFIPTSFLNYACALSKMKVKEFIVVIVVGKVISIGLLAYIGSSLIDFIHNPIKALVALGICIVIYFLSKYIDQKID